jgi:hypothetical protein
MVELLVVTSSPSAHRVTDTTRRFCSVLPAGFIAVDIVLPPPTNVPTLATVVVGDKSMPELIQTAHRGWPDHESGISRVTTEADSLCRRGAMFGDRRPTDSGGGGPQNRMIRGCDYTTETRTTSMSSNRRPRGIRKSRSDQLNDRLGLDTVQPIRRACRVLRRRWHRQREDNPRAMCGGDGEGTPTDCCRRD